jgi:hypothetical protein
VLLLESIMMQLELLHHLRCSILEMLHLRCCYSSSIKNAAYHASQNRRALCDDARQDSRFVLHRVNMVEYEIQAMTCLKGPC